MNNKTQQKSGLQFLKTSTGFLKAISALIFAIGSLGIACHKLFNANEGMEVKASEIRINQTFKVRTDRTYFYNDPDINSRRRSYCIKGDKIFITKGIGDFVFGTYTNTDGIKTTGWLLKNEME